MILKGRYFITGRIFILKRPETFIFFQTGNCAPSHVTISILYLSSSIAIFQFFIHFSSIMNCNDKPTTVCFPVGCGVHLVNKFKPHQNEKTYFSSCLYLLTSHFSPLTFPVSR